MILHPSVLAVIASSLATAGLLLYAARWGVAILRRWDPRSGSSRQLALERRTYLVSAVVAYVLPFQLASTFLYVFTADALAPLFTGAMCAAGTLNAGPLGYPVLLLKLANSVLAGLWLALNHVDARGEDYPLVRPKYAFLVALTPLVVAEAGLQAAFFAGLRPEVITSCCGSLFARSAGGVAGELASLPPGPTAAAFFGTLAAAVAAGLLFRATGAGGPALAVLAGLSLPVALAAVIGFLSPYVYELPTHHCPFCLLQREYGFVGYPLYAALLGGAVAGMAVGVTLPFRGTASLASALPAFQRRLAGVAVVLLSAGAGLAAYEVVASRLRM